jgi:hypothetical protein
LKRPLKKLASPGKPTVPISACVQFDGSDGAPAARAVKF